MTFLRSITLLLVVVAVVSAHTWLASPTKRGGNNGEHCRADPGHSWSCPLNLRRIQGDCNTPIICYGPCDRPKDHPGNLAPVTIQRGTTVPLQWPRNNHSGGFIRIAWARHEDSDSHHAFDINVYQTTCHETGNGCQSGDPINNPIGSDGPNVGPCTTTTSIPLHLEDGLWTMQFAWYGGDGAFGDYFSCKDYQISGGPTGPKLEPIFRADDYRNPTSGQCNYYSSNRLHVCQIEPCNEYRDVSSFGPVTQLGVPNLDVPRIEMWPSFSVGSTSVVVSFQSALGDDNIGSYVITLASNAAMSNVVDTRTITVTAEVGPGGAALAEPIVTHSVEFNGLTSGTTYYVQVTTTWSALANSYPNKGANWQLPQGDVAQFTTSAGTSAQPATTGVVDTGTKTPETSAPPPSGNVYVVITITLPRQPVSVDLNTFVRDIATLLDIPAYAITETTLDLDRSTDFVSVITFRIVLLDGMNLSALITNLKDLTENEDPLLAANGLGGMKVLAADEVGAASHVATSVAALVATSLAIALY